MVLQSHEEKATDDTKKMFRLFLKGWRRKLPMIPIRGFHGSSKGLRKQLLIIQSRCFHGSLKGSGESF